MWTSQEILLKVLRLSNKNIIISIFFLLLFGPLFSEEEKNYGILIRGPYLQKGLPFLEPNILDYTYGEYLYNNEIVKIYISSNDIVLGSEWGNMKCMNLNLKKSEDFKNFIIVYKEKKNWTLFITFEKKKSLSCIFINSLINRIIEINLQLKHNDIIKLPGAFKTR
jgi:hypothetical protein